MGKKQFELTLKTEEVVLGVKPYTIKELDGIQKGKYLNSMGSRVILNDQAKVVGFKDYGGLESSLLCLCLYDGEILVDKKTIESWPSTVLTSLFEIAQELSGLNEDSKKKLEDEAKNS